MGSIFKPKTPTLPPVQPLPPAPSDELSPEEQAKLDTLVLLAQKKQIDLLKSRDKANEQLVELVEPKWYENQYLWLGIGFILGKI